jgi:Zn-dependent protease
MARHDAEGESGGARPRGLCLGRIAGVEIRLDPSLVIIFLLITVLLSMGLLPSWHPDWSAALRLFTAAAAAVLFLVSVLLHELSHAIVGRSLGMRIERITLFVFGGIAHLEDEPATWRTEFAMAIVGPITSVAIGILCLLLAGPIEIDPAAPLQSIAQLGPVPTLLMWLGPVNILLAAFNLVPGFPLDGGRVLRSLLWGASGDLQRATRWASLVGQAFAWLLIGSGLAMILGLQVPVFGSGLVGGLWLALIGWFLNNAAMMSYRQVVLNESLRDLPVTRVMYTDYSTVASDDSVHELVEKRLLHSSQRAFPVQQHGGFVGLACLEDANRVPRDEWQHTQVGDIMTERQRLHTLPPAAMASEALKLLGEHRINQIPVVADDRLLGLVTRENIVTWLVINAPRDIDKRRGGKVLPGNR